MSDGLDIRFVGDLTRLEIGPDDRFVLSVDNRITPDLHARLQDVWEKFAGNGVPLLILEPGMRLGAINVKALDAA